MVTIQKALFVAVLFAVAALVSCSRPDGNVGPKELGSSSQNVVRDAAGGDKYVPLHIYTKYPEPGMAVIVVVSTTDPFSNGCEMVYMYSVHQVGHTETFDLEETSTGVPHGAGSEIDIGSLIGTCPNVVMPYKHSVPDPQ